ncbi:hypothetical protein HMPREF1557_00988 [Streptococcus sobrinus W1703]|uniref:Uncharacterized protein n=1 Tax=Streptococcus sobrinus W1703 TaxID=1227275 RepID=U2KNK7_9STRE|nr:hypothetical protein HMPREF1557_00988 [Streptococcus sobrinus W1703]
MIYKPALMEIKVGFLSRLEKENDSELKSKVSICPYTSIERTWPFSKRRPDYSRAVS